ncbi:MAG: DUF2076 domain-containing protein [Acetobacteraceae bacterium]|nr:DUF2076 domain-containing protein [Acetobacteraceae bacterium]
MTNEERDIITQFIERVGGAKASSGFASAPGSQPALPPVDRDADALIADLFNRYPEARYRLTQTAFVQEHGLVEAQNRIKRLEWELDQARQQLQAAQAGAQRTSSGGFLSSIFGGGGARPSAPPQGGYGQPGPSPQWQGAAPPPPQYPPNYQQPQQMFGRGGSGFLGSALSTAAGVAGGVVAANALENLFSGGGHGAASAAGVTPAESPWGSPPPLPDNASQDSYVDSGSWSTDQNVAQNDPGYSDPGNWDSGSNQQASWSDPGGDAGWSDTSNDDTI